MTAATLDVSHTPAVPFTRLVRVELRKLADTRAGRWLLISIVALTLLVLIIQLSVALGQDLHPKFVDFLQGMNTPMAILLPVLGVLSVTSEWSQRTAMVTFTLEPSRMRVVGAKLVSLVLVSVVALVVGLVLGSLANVLYGSLSGNDLVWGSVGKLVLTYFVAYILSMASGFALGALFLNSPAGIVVYFAYSFVLPIPFAIGAALMGWFDTLRPWIDFNFAQTPLIDGTIQGSEWAHLVTSGLIWLGLPLAIGLWRIGRSEVK
ncbi:MAG TPA: ABC transporter permease [Nocardioides sp.]|jgi:ABC-type transport system involved in multi-copper enzyme maturation permease subunit|nr:ABC transporter permease [Nocardioides sp.]